MTPRQKECLDAIRAHIAEHGHSPSYQELRVKLGLASTSGVARVVAELVERGLVIREGGRDRNLVPAWNRPDAVPDDPSTRSSLLASFSTEALRNELARREGTI